MLLPPYLHFSLNFSVLLIFSNKYKTKNEAVFINTTSFVITINCRQNLFRS